MVYYKYMSLEGLEKVLENCTLKITDPTTFNDPFDCNFPKYQLTREVFIEFFKEPLIQAVGPDIVEFINEKNDKVVSLLDECIKQYEEILNELLRNIQNKWDHFISVYRVLCLTEEKDNTLMWTHYANEFRGAVLGFEFDNLNEFEDIRKVEYDDYNNKSNRMITSWLSKIIEDERIIQNLKNEENYKYEISEYIISKMKDYFFIKKEKWKYEKEYRLVKRGDELEIPNFIKFSKENIKEMIFGLRVSSLEKNKIMELLKENEIQISTFELKKNFDNFLIEKI